MGPGIGQAPRVCYFWCMPLRPVYGHERLRNRLARALAAGRLPQALLLVGPTGVGKQRLGLWIAQSLLCLAPHEGEACEACASCRRVANLEHPDLHWFVPVPRPEGGDADTAVAQAEEALGEVWAERRVSGVWGPADGLAAHHLASVRLLLRRLYVKPALGPRKVFLVGDAERLVPQEQNPEAANALLKGLEEPPGDTTFVLTAAEAHGLLPTVRSRLVPLRVSRVRDADVTQYLLEEVTPVPSGRDLAALVTSAEGVIGSVLTSSRDQAKGALAGRVARVVREGPGKRAEAALSQPPWSARGDFTAALDGLAWSLRERAREELEQGNPIAGRTVAALEEVLETRQLAQGNVNPQLLLANLLDRLAEA